MALKKKQESGSGAVTLQVAAGSKARRQLYVKAMIKSCLISIAFVIGWIPLCICTILYDWAPGVDVLLLNKIIPNLTMISSVQAVSNAFIFWVFGLHCCNSGRNWKSGPPEIKSRSTESAILLLNKIIPNLTMISSVQAVSNAFYILGIWVAFCNSGRR